MSTHTAPRPLAADFRRTLAEFASGVTVVAAVDGGDPVGFACQSFTSVSLDPPLVLFCVTSDSRTWPRIRSAGRFSINVLAEDQHDLCTRFGTRTGSRFDGLEWELSRWGTPSLPGALARLHCELHTVHDGGDHRIVVGEVVDLERSETSEPPMVFFRGRFGLGEDEPVPDQLWSDGWL
ncbi:flavin reductase family protein [Nocardioides sp.]|uniref:flavin reductase family protein n=1 Tax=Nocardioides sp. TaxID=35761 RepID=UPI0025DD62A2|nr:flavin reductase family protein [Nocardioides sp.]